MKSTFSIVLILLLSGASFGQDKFWVLFADKDGVEYNPYEELDPKAIARRNKLGLDLYDYTDLPVRTDYLDIIESIGDSTTYSTRWFNGVACYANVNQIERIAALEFVSQIIPIESQVTLAGDYNFDELTFGQADLLEQQVQHLGCDYLQAKELTGKGIRIAIFDAGFPGVNTSSVFEHIMERDGVVATWDFVSKKENVYGHMFHGACVLSCVGGVLEGHPIGMAPDAEFLLARTEKILTEKISDEENWLAAVEWADRNGADIINSSLGYTTRRSFRHQMDGRSLISRAGNMAARKGILVVNSAGNEAMDPWTTIGAPADADSVLAVGAINPWTLMHTSFSSYGPTGDYRMKPNVTAFGHVMAYAKGVITETQGTSFSSPLIAGLAACLWQSDTSLTCMEVFAMLEQSGSLYPYYDYAHGFGIPDPMKALETQPAVDTTFDLTYVDGYVKVVIREEAFTYCDVISIGHRVEEYGVNPDDDVYHIEDGYYNSTASNVRHVADYVYYNIVNEDGYLDSYQVVNVLKKEVLHLDVDSFYTDEVEGNLKMRVFYKGHVVEVDL